MSNNSEKYEDIISLPHYVSKKHPQMSLKERSAQFAPFAALTGYNNAIRETSRLTTEKKEIDEELKIILDSKIKRIQEQIQNKPKATFTYFTQDLKKDGGIYITVTGNVEKIDVYKKLIILVDKTEIPISEVIEIGVYTDSDLKAN